MAQNNIFCIMMTLNFSNWSSINWYKRAVVTLEEYNTCFKSKLIVSSLNDGKLQSVTLAGDARNGKTESNFILNFKMFINYLILFIELMVVRSCTKKESKDRTIRRCTRY